MKFALFYLGSYANLLLAALLATVLYMGGWSFIVPVDMVADLLGVSIYNPVFQVLAGALGIFMTLFLLFLRFLPVFPLAEIKAVMPQGDPHGHGDGGDHGHGDEGHLAANQGGGH